MLKKTALFSEHQRLGGRLVDFGGWELPVQYSGVMDEHLACRKAAGLFDVSHMGEIQIEGPGSESFLNFLVTNEVSKLAVGQAQYTALCNESGGIVDDLVIYRRSSQNFLLVVNASNTDKDFQHILDVHSRFEKNFDELRVTNASAQYSQIAVQGPRAAEIVSKISSIPLDGIRTYHFVEGTLCGTTQALIARTGYTGEDGFELYTPWDSGPEIWNKLLEVGIPLGMKPCGLGARDTLRLEMKYPLYGNELSDHTHPLEAGLGWVVKMNKADFLGKAALTKAKQAGLTRQLVGIRMIGKGIPRHGYDLYSETGDRKIGNVTSGTQSPSLQVAIGIGYVELSEAKPGTKIRVDIRGTRVSAEVIPTPFYQRNKT